MDAAAFAQIYESFRQFHQFFGPTFGRQQWREHSRHYLQALLVQSQERRNAENLAEAVSVSARALQRFLTDARWDDDLIIGRLQAWLVPRLSHPHAMWVLDGRDFPKQGLKSVGVARQDCGILGKIANCQAGLCLAHVGLQGRALVDKRLYLPAAWCADAQRCATARVPTAQQRYRAQTELALEMVVQARGHLEAQWVAADAAFGMSPACRDGLAAAGLWYVLDVSAQMTVWPQTPTWSDPPYQGRGRPRTPKLPPGQRRTVEARSGCAPPPGASRGRRSGSSTAQTWMAASRAPICPTPRRRRRSRRWSAWAGPGGTWKPRAKPARVTWAWMSTRPAPGPAGITISPCACWPALSCWACSKHGGKNAPHHTPAGVSGGAGNPAPALVWTACVADLAAGGAGAQRTGQALTPETPHGSFSKVRSPTLKRRCNTRVHEELEGLLLQLAC